MPPINLKSTTKCQSIKAPRSATKCHEETRHMQLRTHLGYRGITCAKCHNHARVGRAKCQCGTIWHQCMIHRIDPTVHKSTKPPTRDQEGKQDEGKKLDSRREAPEVRDNARHAKRMRKAVSRNFLHQHSAHIVAIPSVHLNARLQPKLAAKFPHFAES